MRRAWFTKGRADLESFLSQFATVDEIAITADIIDDAGKLVVQYNLDSYDAIHVATALAANVPNIAAVDRQFTRAAKVLAVHIIR